MWMYRIGVERTKRLLFTGDSLSGKEAAEWGLAVESAPADQLDERFERLLARVALTPVNQLMMMKLMANQTLLSQGLQAAQTLGVVFDGITRHTPEGYAFRERVMEVGFRQAVRERDTPYGDLGPSTFKG
ncbi:MAG: enoyl-CoA hydratase-related protein, partial [Nannocystaceae bacterium]